MKKILIVSGHPNPDSLSEKLREYYRQGAEAAGSVVREIIVRDLDFDLVLHKGYKRQNQLEDDIIRSQDLIAWAEHVVWIYPNWWGTYPALFKAFLDKVLWPGFAFRYRPGIMKWDKLLTGRSARVIITMDTPLWYYRLRQMRPGHAAIKRATLEFCGFKPVRITSLGPVKRANETTINKWLNRVEKLGKHGK